MATTTMRLTRAHPMGSMDRAISITASSSAWVLGLAGAIATVGVAIASATVEAEGITAEAVSQPIADTEAEAIADMQAEPIVDMRGVRIVDMQVVDRRYAPAVVELEPLPVTPMVVHPTL